KSFKTSLDPSPPLGSGLHGRQRIHFVVVPLGQSQALRSPTQSNPLTDVIGKASPQDFHSHFDPTAQSKLAEPHFLFDPRVGKLCHPGALLIDLLSFGRLHLRFKGQQLLRLFHAYQRTSFFSPETTASLKRT